MSVNIKDRLFTFGERGREYYVSSCKTSAGAGRSAKDRYHLTKVITPGYSTIRIRISALNMDSLSELNTGARIVLSEKLITEQLCRGYQGQKSREPPEVAAIDE